MKFSTRVEYGMLALTDIALNSGEGKSVAGPDIAERHEISQKYLEQILTHLKQAKHLEKGCGAATPWHARRTGSGCRRS